MHTGGTKQVLGGAKRGKCANGERALGVKISEVKHHIPHIDFHTYLPLTGSIFLHQFQFVLILLAF